jgi:hypothetical protein
MVSFVIDDDYEYQFGGVVWLGIGWSELQEQQRMPVVFLLRFPRKNIFGFVSDKDRGEKKCQNENENHFRFRLCLEVSEHF